MLILSSAPWNDVISAAKLIRECIEWKGDVCYFVGPLQPLLVEYLQDREEMVVCGSLSWLQLPFTAHQLRRQRPQHTMVLFTGERWYRRLKILSFLAGLPNLIVFNENGDLFRFSWTKLFRHARWRIRQYTQRGRHLGTSGLRLLRKEGLVSLWERFRRRYPVTGRRLNFVKVRLAGLQGGAIQLRPSRNPEVSIVIPAHNQWSFTRRCLRSIQKHTRRDYEVILVDNASTDRTRTSEARVHGLRVVRMEDNVGFVGACNAGAEVARGRYVLFLNNDIVVTPGWLDALCEVFETEPDCGAVGAKLIYPNGTLQESGGILWRNGTAWNYGKFDNPELSEYCYRRRVDYCSGAALMVAADDLRAIGGFDERFAPGYWEDADLCLTLRSRGKTVWFQPRSQLYHFEGASSGTDISRGMKRFQSVNHRVFREKWAHELQRQHEFDPGRLFLARDRNPNQVVLAFDHYVPTPDRDAGSAFFHQFLMRLVAQGYRVILWPDNLFRSPGYTEALQDAGIEVLYGPMSYSTFLASHGSFIDFAIAYRAFIAERYLPPLREMGVPLGYVAVDLEHVREGRRIRLEGSEESRADEILRREQVIVNMVDCVGVHSTEEARIVSDELGGRCVHHLPLAVSKHTDMDCRPGFEERRGLVFVGSTHPPNIDGLKHFVETVWPKVREELEGVRFRVVGDVCKAVPELAREPGIEFMGFVEDLSTQLDLARVFVAPLRYGAGVKGKILEAMNHGIPVVTTEVGVEGSGIIPGVHTLVAKDEEEFSRLVIDLYTQPALWSSLRRQGHELICNLYSPKAFDRQVRRFMAGLTEPTVGRASTSDVELVHHEQESG